MKDAIIRASEKIAAIECPSCRHVRHFGRGYLKSPIRHLHCPKCFISMRIDPEAIDLAIRQIEASNKK